jgi:hypothetical protein
MKIMCLIAEVPHQTILCISIPKKEGFQNIYFRKKKNMLLLVHLFSEKKHAAIFKYRTAKHIFQSA